jgi:hypothetical protein
VTERVTAHGLPVYQVETKNQKIEVVGLMLDNNGMREIFRNGIPFNNLLISN